VSTPGAAIDASGGAPPELPLLLGDSGEEPETLLLIGPLGGTEVVVRRWTAADWSLPPVPERRSAAELLRWLEGEASRGRRLNQSLYALRLWLRGQGGDPQTR
jgi:hypothetical protein